MRPYLSDTCAWLALAIAVTLVCHGTLAQSDENKEPLKNSEQPDTSVVNVDVYYESLCGDSMRFIAEQIAPSYDDLKQHLDITFVPYGKASHTRESETGPWQFSCQHGPAECRGNKAHSCALHAINSSEAAHKQQMMVKLIHCSMIDQSPSTSVPKCAEEAGVSEDTRRVINECISGTLGDDLLAANGDKTRDDFQSPLRFVPAVVINGVYKQENQDLAITNFPKLICLHLPENKKPELCKNVN